MTLRNPTGSLSVLLAAGLFVAGVAGCLTEVERPDTASFRIEAADQVQVITSSRFETPSTGVAFVAADTVLIRGPHQGTVMLGVPTRFFIRATSLTSGNVVSMEVFIGQKRWYNGTQTLAVDEALQFMYGFSGN